jgi:hypothetical protein
VPTHSLTNRCHGTTAPGQLLAAAFGEYGAPAIRGAYTVTKIVTVS